MIPSLISHLASVDVKENVNLKIKNKIQIKKREKKRKILSPSTLKAVTVKSVYTVCNLGVPLDLTLVFQNQITFVESVHNAIISLKVSPENVLFFLLFFQN